MPSDTFLPWKLSFVAAHATGHAPRRTTISTYAAEARGDATAVG